VELEERNREIVRARIIDEVLGTGEAPVVRVGDGHIEFAIDFPAGATITYRGRLAKSDRPDKVLVAGTWDQQAGGIFGSDSGVWAAPAPRDATP